MIKWTIFKGVGATHRITCRTTGGAAVALSGQENFSCVWWAGDDQASGGTLSWAYAVPAEGTGDITVSAALATSLDLGVYQWLLQLPDASAAYARGAFELVAGPGSGTPPATAYGTYADLLDVAPWVRMVASTDTDGAGYGDKRAMARQWLDAVILANYRGSADTGYSDQYGAFARGWRRRSLGPDQYIADLLAADGLVVDARVKRIVSLKAAAYIGQGQIGINNAYAVLGRHCDDRAEAEAAAATVMIDADADGHGDIPVPLGSTNTLFT